MGENTEGRAMAMFVDALADGLREINHPPKIDGSSLRCKRVPECFGGTEDITELAIGLVLGNLFGTSRLHLCIVPFSR